MHLFDKEAKPHPSWRLIVLAVSMLAVGALSISGLVYAMSKQVSIVDDNGYSEVFVTYKDTAAEILAEKGVTLQADDEINFAADERVPDGARIIVSRAVFVYFINGEEEILKKSAKKTVREFLDSAGVTVGEGTILNVSLDAPIIESMTIRLVHSKEETVTVEEVIPYKVTKKANTGLKEGQTRVAVKGSEGIAEKVYKVYYENNKEVSRTLIETNVTKEPQAEIVEYGPAPAKVAVVYHRGTVVSRGGELRYKAVLECGASAYSIKGRTATGVSTKVGVVAVDPKVIPLGSRLYIEAADGSWTYGTAVAADTGGSIKGNKIDLYMETTEEALRFGRRTAKVYILE